MSDSSDPNSSNLLPQELVTGYADFCENRLPGEKARFEELAAVGQSPKTLIISCCDSRVAPEAIFNMAPGDLFVVRNVANLVPAAKPGSTAHEATAAIEFAILGLKVENIVVMGHSLCGGVKAFLAEKEGAGNRQPLSELDSVGNWIQHLEPAWQKSCCGSDADADTKQKMLEEAGVKNSLENLMTLPYVAEGVKAGSLKLFGAWFDVSSGEVHALDKNTGTFHKAN